MRKALLAAGLVVLCQGMASASLKLPLDDFVGYPRPADVVTPWEPRQGLGLVTEVLINGLNRIRPEAVKGVMKLKPGEPYSDLQLKADQEAIQGLGFFQNVLPHAEPMNTGVRVVVDVVEHPIIQKISFSGSVLIADADLRKVMTLQEGQVYNSNSQRADLANIKNLYDKKGYLAQIDSAAFVPGQPGVFDIKIAVVKVADIKMIAHHTVNGIRYYETEDGKPVTMSTKQYVVRRELKTRVGEYFNLETWRRDLFRIWNLGFFDSVQGMDPTSPDIDTIGVGIDLEERRTGQVNVGASYGEVQGVTGFIKLEEANLFGRGQGVSITASRGSTNSGFSLDLGYSNPWIDGRHTGLTVNLYDKLIYRFSSSFFGGVGGDNNTDTRYNERRTGGSLSLSRPLGEFLTIFSGFRIESIRTNNVATKEGDQFIQQDGSVAAVNAGFTNNTRDLDIDPASGHYFKTSLEAGVSNITEVGGVFSGLNDLLGRNNFIKGALDMRYYYSPQGRRLKPDDLRHVIATRVYAGTITGTIPFFEQYFAGGSDSIRGYPEDRFWGKNVVYANFEYRFPLQKAMSLVGFFDYGDAWGGYDTVNTFIQSSSFQGEFGYGVGIHFRTPLGPIRLDLAFNKDGHNRTHFMIGHAF